MRSRIRSAVKTVNGMLSLDNQYNKKNCKVVLHLLL
jgi:hypothetical protein